MTETYRVSFVVPVHNEAATFESLFERLAAGIGTLPILTDWEIILVENGSTDGTRNAIERVRSDRVKTLALDRRGLGLAIRAGIEAARMPIASFFPIDLPFGLDVIASSLDALRSADVVVGSKTHPDSRVHLPFQRSLTSTIYRLLVHALLGLRVGDPQGTLFFRTDVVRPLLSSCPVENAFFTTQLLLAVQRSGRRIIEVPVTYDGRTGRPSRFPLLKESLNIFPLILAERRRLRTLTKQR